ncbi:MAG TPA: methionine--tRNA ligase [Methylomirabilota bacterium]|nr:methionine--tRNA ligase [Methylomirabilota bacterium]
MSANPTRPKFYLTTPIYYTNGLPHVGHTYTTIVADTVRRYKRMCGYDVVMTTGADEHGVNVERAAKKAGIPESEFVARMADEWRGLWDRLGLAADEFIRTTDLEHVRTVQWLFRLCRDAGYVYKGHYTGQYCIFDNAFVPEAKPGDSCPDCGRPTETVTEENYFFKLSAFQKPLLDFYNQHPEFIQPESRRNEIVSFVQGGLKDLSITRTTIRWGIPVPGEEPHVFYVWFDALTAYLSAVGGPEYAQRGFWPADVHLVGKDIIRFHAVYWPAFLMAAGLPLPKQIWAHGWFLIDAAKMSKSKGNVVAPLPIVNVLGMDALRYYLLRETVFGQDGNFSYDALVTRYNGDLANGLGNLASRVLTMIDKYCGGAIPTPDKEPRVTASVYSPDVSSIVGATVAAVNADYSALKFSRALERIWELVAETDGHLTKAKPWTMVEETAQRPYLETSLYCAADAIRIISVMAYPVLPVAAEKIWKQLGLAGNVADHKIEELAWGQLKPGTRIGKIEPIFPRVDKAEAIERIEAMEQAPQKPGEAPAAGTSAATPGQPTPAGATPAIPPATAPAKITIDDFAKVEMRVGQIESAEKVPNADKLLKLMVNIGDEVRQIVAGIATVYEAEKLVGRKVIVVTNLQPRKLRGVESNGMVLAGSSGPDGSPVLAGFLEDVPVGSRLK